MVDRLRRGLLRAGLDTKPDFESAYLDAEIEFTLDTESSQTESEEAVDPTISTEERIFADPTYRISKLAAANNKPEAVTPNSSLEEAVTRMMLHDYSQLAVMVGERDLKGGISWQSIGNRLARGLGGSTVQDFMEFAAELRHDASLFEAIEEIVRHDYVMVRGADRRITGILTAADLGVQFRQLSEPFLLLGEIENHVRRLITRSFSADEIASVRDASDSTREVSGAADLTFGEYVRFVQNPGRWERLGLSLERKVFIAEFERLRRIRNDVMHFDPDGIPEADLIALRRFTRLLRNVSPRDPPFVPAST